MHPTLFSIGAKTFPSFGVFVTLACLWGGAVILALARRRDLPLKETAAYILFGIAVVLAGAKLAGGVVAIAVDGAVDLRNWRDYLRGGGAFHGGLAAGLAFSVWYLRAVRLDFRTMADAVAPGIALGHAIGRIGCFLAGCCYGLPTERPWGVRFPGFTEARHPTQLYEAVLDAANFVFLLAVFRRRTAPGRVFGWYLVNYGIIRFAVEYFRDSPIRRFIVHGSSPFTSLSVAQGVSTGLVALGWIWLTVHPRLRSSDPSRKRAPAVP